MNGQSNKQLELNKMENPILVDTREGSRQLLAILQQRRLPAVAAVPQLEFGDLCWNGNGPNGECKVGVEYKSIRDALSCITSGRYAGHQLPGMLRAYEFSYLLVHGIVREEPASGVLQNLYRGKWWDTTVGQTRYTYRQYVAWLTTMSTMAGVRVVQVGDELDAAAAVHSLYRWWTEKTWVQHGSHKVIYTAPPPMAMLVKPSLCRRWANQLTGVGWEKSLAVSTKFKTAFLMSLAEPWEWGQIAGIGKTLADRIVKEIRGED